MDCKKNEESRPSCKKDERRRPAPKRYNERVERKMRRKGGLTNWVSRWPRLSGGGNGHPGNRVLSRHTLPTNPIGFSGTVSTKGIIQRLQRLDSAVCVPVVRCAGLAIISASPCSFMSVFAVKARALCDLRKEAPATEGAPSRDRHSRHNHLGHTRIHTRCDTIGLGLGAQRQLCLGHRDRLLQRWQKSLLPGLPTREMQLMNTAVFLLYTFHSTQHKV